MKTLSIITIMLLAGCSTLPVAPNANTGIRVFAYHHIENGKPAGETTISADEFLKQINILKNEGYSTITVSELSQYLRNKTPTPEKTVVLTFDDGWRDQLAAAQELKNHNMSGTFFIISGVFDQPGYMTKEDVIGLSENPKFEIGAHTHTHFVKWEGHLDDLSPDTMDNEVFISKHLLEHIINKPVDALAWPYGYHTLHTVQYAGQSGYTSTSMINSQSKNIIGTSPLEIQRINIDGRCNISQFREMLETGNLVECK